MLGLGFAEILVIALVILLVIGPDELPKFMRTAGQYYARARRMADEMRRSFSMEMDRVELDERRRDLEERRKRAAEERKRALELSGGQVVAQSTPDATALLSPD